jgi:FKBP-type peptidyl-prolyl cis-trans isomerase 2
VGGRSLARLGATLVLWVLGASVQAQEAERTATVAVGARVSLEYTLKLGDGSLVETNVGGRPLVYRQGAGLLLPAMEKQLEGMKVDESRSFSLSPDEAYGVADPNLVERVPVAAIPEEARVVGAVLMAQAPTGEQRPMRVREVEDDVIVMDLNHPLAGQTLHYEVKVVSID